MVATVKIIPFAVAAPWSTAVVVASRGSARSSPSIRSGRCGSALIQTVLPGIKDSVLAKTVADHRSAAGALGQPRSRDELRTPHEAEPSPRRSTALARDSDMVIVFGASALCDFDDVIPAAIRQAGGEVLRAGMPVDPGNLLVLGRLGGKPVLGAPGCARSPKENGFDWVLDRLIAGLDVTASDIAGMGVGGLLMEIPTRPQPRETAVAAGRHGGPRRRACRRPFEPHGRAEQADGAVRRQAADPPDGRACAGVEGAGAVVVTGHQAARIREALDGLDVDVAHNPDFASGLSSSLKAGIAARSGRRGRRADRARRHAGVSSADLDRLIAAFRKSGGAGDRARHP